MKTLFGSGNDYLIWMNIFYFTINDNRTNHLPQLWLGRKPGYPPNGCLQYNTFNMDVVLGKQYQITMRQYESDSIFWEEILVDGTSKLKIKGDKVAKSFSNVKFYHAADTLIHPFSSHHVDICNFEIQHGR